MARTALPRPAAGLPPTFWWLFAGVLVMALATFVFPFLALFLGVTWLELSGLDQHAWLRAGFSPSGKHMLVVSASGALVLSRAPAA